MILEKFGLNFEIPVGWQSFTENNRFIIQGTGGEEFTISGFVVEGEQSESELGVIKEKLFQSAVTSVESAVNHPELIITKPLETDKNNRKIACFTLRSQTIDEKIIFIESIIQTETGVAIVTFEAINDEKSKETYNEFMQKISSSI